MSLICLNIAAAGCCVCMFTISMSVSALSASEQTAVNARLQQEEMGLEEELISIY